MVTLNISSSIMITTLWTEPVNTDQELRAFWTWVPYWGVALAKVCRTLLFWIQQAFFLFISLLRKIKIVSLQPALVKDLKDLPGSEDFKMWILTSKSLPLPSNSIRAVTFLEWVSSSGLKVSTATTIGIDTHIGGLKVALHHTPRSAQKACQPVCHTGGSVAGSLLDSDTDLQGGEKRESLLLRGWSQEPTPWDLL